MTTNLMNPRAISLRRALDEWQQASNNWIDKTLALAEELYAAREECGSNDTKFGIWLTENACDDLGRTARAALINLGRHNQWARIAMEDTNSRSPERLWDEVQRRLRLTVHLSESSDRSPPSPPMPKPSPASSDTAKSDPALEQKVVNQESGSALTKRSALAHIQRGEELAAVFRSKKARTMLGNFPKQRGGKYILSLVLEALDAGLIPPNDLEPHQPTLSLLFPLAPVGFVRSYRLDNPKLRPQIRKMLDTMIACRPKLLAEPHRIREILGDYDAAQKAKRQVEIDSKRRNDAIAQLVSGQQELVVFGTTVWPRLDDKQGPYDYDQIRAAIWTFRDQLAWNKITNDNSPGSIGIRIRLSMKWYNEYLMRVDPLRESPCRRVFNLVFWLSKLYEAAPDAECKWPAYPTAEAEW